MELDPIVAEVRAVRDRLAARFDYDIEAIVRHVQKLEAESGRTYVDPPQDAAPAAGTGCAEGAGRGAESRLRSVREPATEGDAHGAGARPAPDE